MNCWSNRNYSWQWGGQERPVILQIYHILWTLLHPQSRKSLPWKTCLIPIILLLGLPTTVIVNLFFSLWLWNCGLCSHSHNSLEALAISMANTIPASRWRMYTPDKSSGLYQLPALPMIMLTDNVEYFHTQLNLELHSYPTGWHSGICQGNLQAAKISNRVNQSTLTGLVKTVTLLPLVAEIYIAGIDNTGCIPGALWESDASFGRYYRFLQNGNYSVTFRHMDISWKLLTMSTSTALVKPFECQSCYNNPLLLRG